MTGPDRILLIGHGSRDLEAIAEYRDFAQLLAQELGIPVQPCFLEFADPPIAEGLRLCVEAGARDIVALPLFLGPAGHQKNDVPAILNWAREEWPELTIRYGAPLGPQIPLIQVLAQRAQEALERGAGPVSPQETGLLLVGRGSRDPDSNSDVAKAARLLYEGRGFPWVDFCFYSLATPQVPESLERLLATGLRRVIVLPYLLFTGRIRQRIQEQAQAVQAAHPEAEILVADHLGLHPGVIQAVTQRYQEALEGRAAMSCDLCKYRVQMAGFEAELGLPQFSDHHHGLRGVHGHGHSHDHGLAARMAALLPPRYQGETEVSPEPMGAAGLVFDQKGRVAWDRIWEDFCDLALAGGPPHRGELLEPVDPARCQANPEGYRQVLAEVERGLRMVTGLEVVRSEAPGWIGLVCDSQEMAIWLLRAIVVENVFARREGTVLYLPVGPDFTLAGEIKNIVTVVAKTHHYWQEHLQAVQLS